MDRSEVLKLLYEYVTDNRLLKHVFAVEGAMIGYAEKFDKDPTLWGTVGLLHDLDFEKYPKEHPNRTLEILTEKNYSQEIIDAIKGHASPESNRDTSMAKTLFAVDQLASFIIACALVRPNKFDGLKPKSVKKKMKDKAFAKAVDRNHIQQGADELGLDLSQHIETVIQALKTHEQVLNKEGLSLID